MTPVITFTIGIVLLGYWVSIYLYIIVKRRPLFFNMIWYYRILPLILLPSGIFLISDSIKNPSLYNIPFIFVCLALIVWAILKRPTVTIYGIYYYDFLHEITEYLKDKKIEYNKSRSSIKIKNPEMAISIFGEYATIHFNNRSHKKEFDEFVSGLKMRQIEGNIRNAITHLILWILMGTLIIYLSIITLHR
jgi:hypothetical protein